MLSMRFQFSLLITVACPRIIKRAEISSSDIISKELLRPVRFYDKWGNSGCVIPRYCFALSRCESEIDRRNIAKVRDFTIIIDEGRIINAVILPRSRSVSMLCNANVSYLTHACIIVRPLWYKRIN